MDQKFLDQVKALGSPYLTKFVMEHRINGPQQLAQLLERHAGTLEAAMQRLQADGLDKNALSRFADALPKHLQSGAGELTHVQELIGQVKQRFSG